MSARWWPPAALWLGLSLATTLPYWTAYRTPPPGTRFVGAIFFPDDYFQYLSFAEQAQRGHFLFENKFDRHPHAPALVNLEWWLAGVLGRWLGDLALGFHTLRLGALAALLLGVAGVLGLAGLDGVAVGWGTAFVTLAGGLGWLRLGQGTPGWQIPDINSGLYPWHQALFNGHFLVGTALLVWTLLLYLRWRQGAGPRWPWLACGWLLGLSRPYDLATFTMIVLAAALWEAPRGGWKPAFARCLKLMWLAPLFGYYAMLTLAHPSYRGWGTQSGDLSPPFKELLVALAPAAALIALFARSGGAGGAAADARRHLALWSVCLVGLLAIWQQPMAKQVASSLGAAVLLWAATVTPVRWLPWATLALSPTSLFLLWRAFNPFPNAFAPADYFAAVEFLGRACAPEELALAPTDLSLMIGGRTPCKVSVGHRLLTPRYAEEVADATRFYEHSTPIEQRLAYLRGHGFSFVALPAGGRSLLGNDAPYQPVLERPSLELFRTTERDAAGESVTLGVSGCGTAG